MEKYPCCFSTPEHKQQEAFPYLGWSPSSALAPAQQLHLLAALVGITLRATDLRDSKVSKSQVPAAGEWGCGTSETSAEEPFPSQRGPAHCHCLCLKPKTSLGQGGDASRDGSTNISAVARAPAQVESDLRSPVAAPIWPDQRYGIAYGPLHPRAVECILSVTLSSRQTALIFGSDNPGNVRVWLCSPDREEEMLVKEWGIVP